MDFLSAAFILFLIECSFQIGIFSQESLYRSEGHMQMTLVILIKGKDISNNEDDLTHDLVSLNNWFDILVS